MAKTIICIHGRLNKPQESTLINWWKSAIKEGLDKNTASSLNFPIIEMAYHADISYPDGPIPDDNVDYPYKRAKRGALKFYKEDLFDHLKETAGSILGDTFDRLFESYPILSETSQTILESYLEDLSKYYSDKVRREEINKRLKEILLHYKDNEIILVAHSMGSIIAYDVLRELGRDTAHPGFIVEHLFTIGSPLGLIPIKGNILNNHKKLRTPSCVRTSWLNFSDPHDIVCCLDPYLKDDYEPNSSSIRVEDILVHNDYPGNEHSSYGYLRTPEFSNRLALLL